MKDSWEINQASKIVSQTSNNFLDRRTTHSSPVARVKPHLGTMQVIRSHINETKPNPERALTMTFLSPVLLQTLPIKHFKKEIKLLNPLIARIKKLVEAKDPIQIFFNPSLLSNSKADCKTKITTRAHRASDNQSTTNTTFHLTRLVKVRNLDSAWSRGYSTRIMAKSSESQISKISRLC